MNNTIVQALLSGFRPDFGANTAIERGDRCISYRELEDQANRFANMMLSIGTPKGSTIALILDDPIDIIATIIGILKAGCAFIPLDSGSPDAWLALMIKELDLGYLITDTIAFQRVRRIVGNGNTTIIVTGDEGRYRYLGRGGDTEQVVECFDPTPCYIARTPDDMCYVYFTSGSTGKPKGIAGRHKSLSHFIEWEIDTLALDKRCRTSHFTIPTFDAYLRDVFVPLCTGGTICVPESRDDVVNAERLVRWIDKSDISVIHCVPSLFRSIMSSQLDKDYFRRLQYILMAGESLFPADIERWMNVFGNRVQLVNLYGASEATMAKFFYFVQSADKNRPYIPIGKPIRDAEALVLDEHGAKCLPGIAGEIHIRTPFLTLGYYRQPELTQEVFIPNPCGTDPRDIVYKTGDLGMVLDDGNLRFIGRNDDQVKVRGFRIELGEIEAAIRLCPDVDDAVAVARRSPFGEVSLIGYVVPRPEYHLAIDELRRLLQAKLPDYMVPTSFVLMKCFPLTTTGKVDRQALPPPDRLRPELASRYQAPRTVQERLLTEMWSDALDIERIGIHDDFFALGGHSLSATRILSRIRDTFDLQLSWRSFLEAPTVAGLAELLTAVPAIAQEPVTPPLLPISPRPRTSPLSFSQQRLWFLSQLQPDESVYSVSASVRLKGMLNVESLRRGLNEVVRRHEILRTTFEAVEGQPVQVIAPSLVLDLPLMDLSALTQLERENMVRRLAHAEMQRTFDLDKGPLLRAELLRLDESDHVLLLTLHHIISDGWSTAVLFQELATLYVAYSTGKPSPLPELPLQYADYALWQRRWLQGEVLERQLSYWHAQLADGPAVLDFPTDFPRPPVLTSRGASHSFVVSAALHEALHHVTRREGVTLFMVLLATFQTLLARYTGQRDIAVGTPIANRSQVTLERLIGFFVNTLVLRTSLSDNPTFNELLCRVRDVALGAYEHQDLPFDQLVEALQPMRDPSRNPLFQVAFAVQNAPSPPSRLGELDLSIVEIENQTTKFDLYLVMQETTQGLVGKLHYSVELFEAATIRRIAEHFLKLLEEFTSDPTQRVLQTAFITEAERDLIMNHWNDTGKTYPQQGCLHELFEKQARRTPDAVAVVFEDQHLTFRALDERANQLARYLRNLGVGPEVNTGIYLERSLNLVVGLLGVLKAGGIYVPLDTAYPQARLSLMMDDAQVSVLLTEQRLVAGLTTHTARPVYLDMEYGAISRERGDSPIGGATVDNGACIMYTSGSTGTPYGVILTHRGLRNRLLCGQDAYRLTRRDSIIHKASISFDASIWELFWPLIVGARLILARPGGQGDSSYLVKLMETQDITFVHYPPAMLRVILEEQHLDRFARLRRVFTGGDVLPVEVQERLFDRLAATLHNQYGPTETSCHVTTWTCVQGTNRRSVPIGRPIANTRIYLLDEHMQPVPIGVPGELYCSGAGLARGYLKRPDLTATKFVPHPFTDTPGERLYRTGDRARYLHDGAIEFLGRLDYQVKVRGFRVELGEIEAVLRRHPSIRESVALVYEDPFGDKRLVAYIVVDPNFPPSSATLRSFLQNRLPEYMIPATFVTLDALPLTSNGKLDRRSLPMPTDLKASLDTSFVAPSTVSENLLTDIWTRVLGVECIGIHDGFFALGGHSLLATRIVSQIRTAFGLDVRLRSIFEAPTVAELAALIDTMKWAVQHRHRASGSTVQDHHEEGTL